MFNLVKRIWNCVSRLFSYEFWHLNYVIGKKIHDHCIMYLPASLGDTLLILNNLDKIEEDSGVKIFPVIKNSHVVIPELLGYKNEFLVCDEFSKLFALPCVKKIYHCISGAQVSKKLIHEFQTGTLFLAHPCYFPETSCLLTQGLSESELFGAFFGLHFMLVFPESVCRIKNTLGIPDPEHSILLCPEAATVNELPHDFWSDLSCRLEEMGWNLYYNAIEPVSYLPKVRWLNCSARDAVAFGQSAAYVISLRSGLCDCLADMGGRLIVIYPDIIWGNDVTCFDAYDLNRDFGRTDIKTCIYKNKEQTIAFIISCISYRH